MALVVKDRVQETSNTTGTGTFTLAGAVSGFQSFSVIGDGNTTYYAIVGGTEFEVGIGTYTALGTVLSRDTILESSNGGSAVNFSAGTKNVFVTYPAEKGLYLDASGNAIALGTPASATLTNATGLPISTGVSGLGTNVATFLATPTSANLAAALTDETGTGASVFATSPTIASPTFTSQSTFAAGTAAAPSVTTTGDTNTGIFFPAADTIAFAEGGAESMRIDSSGNVGIGATSTGAKLYINKATNGDAFVVDALGGSVANFAVQGSGEQTFRLYNNASTGSTRTSIKLASRLNTDWEWIGFTDGASTGINDLSINNLAGTAVTIDATRNMVVAGTISSSSVAVGDLGTYAWLAYSAVATATIVAGTNYAGSGLRYFGYTGSSTGSVSGGTLPATTPSGTWKAMGNVANTSSLIKHTLYLRVA